MQMLITSLVPRALACGEEGPWIEITFDWVHPAANGYPTLFRAGEGLGREGRGDGHHPSHAMPSDTCGTLTFNRTANWLWDLL